MLGTQVSTRLSPLFSLYRDALICVVFVMTFRIAFSGQTFDVEDRQLALLSLTSDSGNPIEQAIILFVFVNSLFLARLSRLPLRTIAFGMAPFAGLLLFALVSVLWSEYPWLTLRRALRFVTEVTTLNLLALTYRDECDRILRLFFRMFAVITVASFVSLAAPTFSFWAESFKGIFLQKLDAGRFFFLRFQFLPSASSIGRYRTRVWQPRRFFLLPLGCCRSPMRRPHLSAFPSQFL